MSERSTYKNSSPGHFTDEGHYNDRQQRNSRGDRRADHPAHGGDGLQYEDGQYSDSRYTRDERYRYTSAPATNHPNARHAENHHDPRGLHDTQPRNFPDRVEEVWLKESRGRITFNDSDLMDISRQNHSNMNTTLAGFAGVVAMIGLIGFLALSSTPDLTPQEIIASQDYGGEQTTKTPFNLASLRDCDDIQTCAETMHKPKTVHSDQNVDVTQTITAGSTPTIPDAVIIQESTTFRAQPQTEITFAEDNLAGYEVLEEIPAATSLPAIDATFSDTNNSDQLIVLQQWSNVRGTPDINGEILTSLAEGTNVTLLRQTGQWFEVSVFKGKLHTGYMHRSTVTFR